MTDVMNIAFPQAVARALADAARLVRPRSALDCKISFRIADLWSGAGTALSAKLMD